MESYLFAIDRSNPEHWSYAVRDGIWDTTKRLVQQPISVGDLMYFWQSGGGIVGVASATSAMYKRGSAPMPWNVDDDKLGDYKWRIDLSPIQSGSATPLTWPEIAAETGTPALQAPRRVPRNQEWLAEKVLGHSKAEEVFEALLQSVNANSSALGEGGSEAARGTTLFEPVPDEDTRRKELRAIHVRQGQPQFRGLLLENYEGRCAVSGCTTEALLDAAHITPYRGSHANVAHNGILLRTDLHTLFDKHLMTVVPSEDSFTVHIDPDVDEYYQQFEGRTLAVRPGAAGSPSAHELKVHNDACEFLFPDGA